MFIKDDQLMKRLSQLNEPKKLKRIFLAQYMISQNPNCKLGSDKKTYPLGISRGPELPKCVFKSLFLALKSTFIWQKVTFRVQNVPKKTGIIF